jgi:Flp pilus assembly pilin Flp
MRRAVTMRSMRGQRGQAMTEYLVIGAFCLMVLVLVALGPAPIVELVSSIKKFFSAYSYAISITPATPAIIL